MTAVLMMVAMMAPGAVPATARHVRSEGTPRSAAAFAVTYLALWALVGLALFGLYSRPGSTVSGTIVIAAGLYELTPVKQAFRRRCRGTLRSGLDFGISCLGSNIGLMLVLVAINMMSVPWMAVVGAVALAQKLVRENTVVDVAIALAVVALGLLILVAPSAVPGFVTSMSSMTSM